MERNTYSLVLVACAVAVCAAMVWAGDDTPAPARQNSVAIRAKAGGMFPLAGDYDDIFSEHIQGELGVKGTFSHLGLEMSLGMIRGDETIRERLALPGDDVIQQADVDIDLDGELNAVKLTATLELNPLAGVKGHEKEFNAYAGIGFGYYPSSIDVKVRASAQPLVPEFGVARGSIDYDGYGPHAVVGAEYFFGRVFGVFAEAQYLYLKLEPDEDLAEDLDLHGVSVLGGISLKF